MSTLSATPWHVWVITILVVLVIASFFAIREHDMFSKQPFRAVVNMDGELSKWDAVVLIARDKNNDFPEVSAPKDPKERVLRLRGSNYHTMLKAPAWRKVEGRDENGDQNIMMLGALYTIPDEKFLYY